MFDKINRLSLKVYSGCNFNCSFCHQLVDDKYKPFQFSDFKNLERFLVSLPLDDSVDITITGGEITLAKTIFENTLKSLRKVERKTQTIFHPCIITNGSKMELVLKWIENRWIEPHKVSISWDGIHNSLSRRSNIPDQYFLDMIKQLGGTIYNEDISIVHAINPTTIDYLADSFKYCFDNNMTNIGYYFIHEAKYDNLEEKFKNQIEKIAKMVVEYSNNGKAIYYYNWQNIYTTRQDSKNFFLCNKLGNNYHIDMFGDIYPCIYFGDHRTLKIGNIIDGIDEKMLKHFEDMYLRVPNCPFKECGCTHCTECPASNYVHNGAITERFKNICKLQQIENEVFDKYSKLCHNSLYIPNDVHNNLEIDGLKECLSCSGTNGISSPNYNAVRGW